VSWPLSLVLCFEMLLYWITIQSWRVQKTMQNCTTINHRLSALAWQVTLGMTILVTAWFKIVGLSVQLEVTPDMIALVPSYIFLIVYCRFIRPNTAIAGMLITVGQLVIVVVMGIMLSYAASSVTLPYRDGELLAMDRWLGFEREAYMAFLQRHESLREMLMLQNLLICAVSLLVQRMDRLQAYVATFAIAVTATAFIASFVPAANALIYVDKVPTDLSTLPGGGHSYFPTLEALRAGALRTINFNSLEGLISFPSFHTANAILLIWALWPLRILRFVILPLNLLMIASTPLAGAHYFVDLIGGAVTAFGAIFVTTWLVRSPSTASSAPAGEKAAVEAAGF
jgi:membrane-associated phospholipid phosphatase